MEMIAAYRANDGTIFESQESAALYEASLLWRDRLDEFAASDLSPYTSGAGLSMMHKSIIAWERWKAEKGVA